MNRRGFIVVASVTFIFVTLGYANGQPCDYVDGAFWTGFKMFFGACR